MIADIRFLLLGTGMYTARAGMSCLGSANRWRSSEFAVKETGTGFAIWVTPAFAPASPGWCCGGIGKGGEQGIEPVAAFNGQLSMLEDQSAS